MTTNPQARAPQRLEPARCGHRPQRWQPALTAPALLVSAAVLLAAAGAAHAQQPPPSAASFDVQRYDVGGPNPLSADETRAVLAPFTGSGITLERLQQATVALEARLRERGYSLHRVSLPAQELGGVVKLTVVRFTMGKVTFKPAGDFDEANLKASVPELVGKDSPNLRELARQVAIANENPAKRTTIGLRESEQPDAIDAEVRVDAVKPWSVSLSSANTGNRTTGRDRTTLAVQHANLANRDIVGNLAYTTSLDSRAGDVKQWGLAARWPLYRQGAVLTASVAQSNVVGSFGGFDVTGAGNSVALGYQHTFAPQGNYRATASVGLDLKRFKPSLFNGVPVTPLGWYQDSHPLTLGYAARSEVGRLAYAYNLDWAINLPGGRGNHLTAYRDSDPRIDTTRWQALRAGANMLYTAESGYLINARMLLQYSPDALLAGEQFGLGGAGSIRGLSERALAGDSGVLLGLEVQSAALLNNTTRVIGFIDSGWLSNQITSAAKPASDHVLSAGIGLRIAYDRYLSLNLDWAKLFSGSTTATLNPGTHRGASRIHASLTLRY